MWKKSKVVRIVRKPSPTQIMVDQKQMGNVYYFSHLSNMIGNDAMYTSNYV